MGLAQAARPAGRSSWASCGTIYHFATSPVPEADRWAGNLPDSVTGIEVGQQVDALFFLQTATIPVTAEGNVDNSKQTSLRALPDSELAWIKPYAGTAFSAVVYCL